MLATKPSKLQQICRAVLSLISHEERIEKSLLLWCSWCVKTINVNSKICSNFFKLFIIEFLIITKPHNSTLILTILDLVYSNTRLNFVNCLFFFMISKYLFQFQQSFIKFHELFKTLVIKQLNLVILYNHLTLVYSLRVFTQVCYFYFMSP